MKSLYRVLKKQDELHVKEFEAYPEFSILPFGEETEGKPDESLEEAEETEAREKLQEALRQAEEIIAVARRQAEDICKEAKEEGYQRGQEEGLKAGLEQALRENREKLDKEVTALQNRICQYVKDVEIEKEKLLEQHIDDLKNISLTIGEKIVQTSLRSSSDVVERMILAATEKLKKSAWAKIYVGQGTREMDIHGDARFLQELSRLSENVKIIVMEEEEPGTCIVELPDEVIDISVGTQLENIKEILNNARL